MIRVDTVDSVDSKALRELYGAVGWSAYIQDILVAPPHQGRGVGRALVMAILERYAHVRQKVLLTDNRPEQLRF